MVATSHSRGARGRISALVVALTISWAGSASAHGPIEHELEENTEALARNPNDSALLLDRSVLLSALGRHDEASASIDRVERFARADRRIPAFRARIELARGRVQDARVILDTHLRRFPDDHAALLLRAEASERLDVIDEALDDLRAALLVRYDDTLALRIARLLRARHQDDEAARMLLAAANRDGAHPAVLLEAIAIHRARREVRSALHLVDRLAEGAAVPTRMEILRGEILRDAGQRAASLRAYRRALALANATLARRVSAAALVERARARMGLADFDDAIIDLEAARTLAPEGLPEVFVLLEAATAGRYAP